MKRLIGLAVATSLVAIAGVAMDTNAVQASDHDDGEIDAKARALNLTDHFTFVSTDPATPNDLSMIMYFNPRSLPGKEYFLSTNARYEFHVSKIATKTTAPSGAENFVFRFEAGAPDATTGVQPITLTVIKDGAVVGTNNGSHTTYAASKAGTLTTNPLDGVTGFENGKYFIGARADAFHFDVVRFFQVRAFLADRFFGGSGGIGRPGAATDFITNNKNCEGEHLLQGTLPNTTDDDVDKVNLWNPASCAADFTKDYNVMAIVLNVPIASLDGGSVFDTWSTISVAR